MTETTTSIDALYNRAAQAEVRGEDFAIPAKLAMSLLDHVNSLRHNLEAERQQREAAEAAALAMRDDMRLAREELAALRGEILSAKQEINWPIAQKVRAALDRAACPDAFMRIAVEACTDALRGEQDPVAWIKCGEVTTEPTTADVWIREMNEGYGYDVEVLCKRQPKPVVVLPEKLINDCNRYNIDYQDTVNALKAAGIDVKDGQ